MTDNSRRAGKLQVELDREQVIDLITFVRAAAEVVSPRRGRPSPGEVAAWLEYRAIRKWGPDATTRRRPGRQPRTPATARGQVKAPVAGRS